MWEAEEKAKGRRKKTEKFRKKSKNLSWKLSYVCASTRGRWIIVMRSGEKNFSSIRTRTNSINLSLFSINVVICFIACSTVSTQMRSSSSALFYVELQNIIAHNSLLCRWRAETCCSHYLDRSTAPYLVEFQQNLCSREEAWRKNLHDFTIKYWLHNSWQASILCWMRVYINTKKKKNEKKKHKRKSWIDDLSFALRFFSLCLDSLSLLQHNIYP